MKIMRILYGLIALVTIVLSSNNIFAAEKVSFERTRVAVIPSEAGTEYTRMIENALGVDKRFDFVDPKLIPGILKEWEKRQTGAAGEDDTQGMALKTVDYLIFLTNLTKDVTYKPALKKGEIPQYECTINATLKIGKVNEGGSTDTIPVSASSQNINPNDAEKSAKSSLASSITVSLKKAFPIEAQLADISSGSLKILRGKNTGIEEGQRYVIQSPKNFTASGKEYKAWKTVGFIQIDNVYDDYSDAYIIHDDGIKADNSKAVESYYAGGSFELFSTYLHPDTNRSGGPFKKNNDFTYEMGFYGGINWQFGLNIGVGLNSGFWRMPLDLTLRYNQHVYRACYVNFGVTGEVDFGWKKEELRSKSSGTDAPLGIKRYLSGTAFSCTPFIGLKYLMGESTYLFTTVGYSFGTDFSWKYSAGSKKSGESDSTYALRKDSIKNYDKYMPTYRLTGVTCKVGLGINF